MYEIEMESLLYFFTLPHAPTGDKIVTIMVKNVAK